MFKFMNCELKMLVVVMHPRYIFAVTCHIVLHGGLGHQPFPSEELGPIGVLFGKHTKTWLFIFRSCKFWCELPYPVWFSDPKPHLNL